MLLKNRELLRDKHLTLAGNLMFGITPQRYCPLFYIPGKYRSTWGDRKHIEYVWLNTVVWWASGREITIKSNL